MNAGEWPAGSVLSGDGMPEVGSALSGLKDAVSLRPLVGGVLRWPLRRSRECLFFLLKAVSSNGAFL